MKYIIKFNEELNFFSKKKEEDYEIKFSEKEDELAKKILNKLSKVITSDDIKEIKLGFTCYFDSDEIKAYRYTLHTNYTYGLTINKEKIDCSQETSKKLYDFFYIHHKNIKVSNRIDFINGLYNKYK